jgi:hypothetical protein
MRPFGAWRPNGTLFAIEYGVAILIGAAAKFNPIAVDLSQSWPTYRRLSWHHTWISKLP